MSTGKFSDFTPCCFEAQDSLCSFWKVTITDSRVRMFKIIKKSYPQREKGKIRDLVGKIQTDGCPGKQASKQEDQRFPDFWKSKKWGEQLLSQGDRASLPCRGPSREHKQYGGYEPFHCCISLPPNKDSATQHTWKFPNSSSPGFLSILFVKDNPLWNTEAPNRFEIHKEYLKDRGALYHNIPQHKGI